MSLPDSRLWLRQARSDFEAAQYLAAANQPEWNCHVVAKYQQSVEKTVKALTAALDKAGVVTIKIGFSHQIDRYVKTMLRRDTKHEVVRNRLSILFNRQDRMTINTLMQLAPRQPEPNGLFQRNTEYPYRLTATQWTIPAEEESFSADEIKQFARTAGKLLNDTDNLIKLLARGVRT